MTDGSGPLDLFPPESKEDTNPSSLRVEVAVNETGSWLSRFKARNKPVASRSAIDPPRDTKQGLVETMEGLVGKITEQNHRIARLEVALQRVEELVAETTAQVGQATNAKETNAHALEKRWSSSLRLPSITRSTYHHWLTVVGGLVLLAVAPYVYTRAIGDAAVVDTMPVASKAGPVFTASMLMSVVDTPRPALPPSQSPQMPTDQLAEKARVRRSSLRPSEFNGTLTVESQPSGAAVFMNQRLVGTTPLQLHRLPARSYALWIERAGYERWTAAILVPADKITRIMAKLQSEAPH